MRPGLQRGLALVVTLGVGGGLGALLLPGEPAPRRAAQPPADARRPAPAPPRSHPRAVNPPAPRPAAPAAATPAAAPRAQDRPAAPERAPAPPQAASAPSGPAPLPELSPEALSDSRTAGRYLAAVIARDDPPAARTERVVNYLLERREAEQQAREARLALGLAETDPAARGLEDVLGAVEPGRLSEVGLAASTFTVREEESP